MFRAVLVIVVLSVLVVAVAAFNLNRDPSAYQIDWAVVQLPPPEVTLDRPTRGLIVQTLTAPGTVEAVDEAEIASQLVGRVISVYIKDGDQVKTGDMLIKLDDTDARARLDSALARLERLRAVIVDREEDLKKAKRDLARQEDLDRRGAGTKNALDDASTAVAKMEALLRVSRQELVESEAMRRSSEKELDYTEIRAPIDGVVAGLEVEVGEVVIAGTTNLPGTVLMTVGNLSRMRVRAEVDETDIPLVKLDQQARIFLQADSLDPILGKVEQIAPKGKLVSEVVSFETLVSITELKEAVRAGMTSTVEIAVKRSEDALGVPVQAVVHRRRKDLPNTPEIRAWSERQTRAPGEKAVEAENRYLKIVFVMKDGKAHARPVETGISDERRVEILSGLAADEQVITGPFRALDTMKDNQAVVLAKPEAESGQPGGKPPEGASEKGTTATAQAAPVKDSTAKESN